MIIKMCIRDRFKMAKNYNSSENCHNASDKNTSNKNASRNTSNKNSYGKNAYDKNASVSYTHLPERFAGSGR